MAVEPPLNFAHRGSPASGRNEGFEMNVAVKMNEERGGEIFYLKPSKHPLSPGFPDKTAAATPFFQADISTMCVSKSPDKERTIVPARIVAEAVRLILDIELPPPREPGRRCSDDVHDEFGDDLLGLDSILARTPEQRDERLGLLVSEGYRLLSPPPVVRAVINRDKAYRSRATLREVCRNDPSAFADAIPHDIADRVTVPNSHDEAHAILSAVADKRPARAWRHADPNEPVTLIDYAPPSLRLRSRSIPGVVVTRDGDAIVLPLRDRVHDSPSMRSAVANKRQEAKPEPIHLEATVINLAARKAYLRDWKQRFELAQRAA
jgi:hypothetical protein